jgi:outer membrane lipoprotein-sorting protein
VSRLSRVWGDMVKKSKLLIATLIVLMVAVSACADESAEHDVHQPLVIEPGIEAGEAADDDQQLDQEGFADKGEATTIADLIQAQEQISSYYFEQNIPYSNGSVFMRVWYAGGKMKVVTSESGRTVSEEYYDYHNKTQTVYFASDNYAYQTYFNPYSEVAPVNPKQDDYSSYTYLGQETIEGQLCLLLEAPIGDKLWVSTKYGFPLQVEFVDSFGERYTVAYLNVSINDVDKNDVEIPTGLLITDISGY